MIFFGKSYSIVLSLSLLFDTKLHNHNNSLATLIALESLSLIFIGYKSVVLVTATKSLFYDGFINLIQHALGDGVLEILDRSKSV